MLHYVYGQDLDRVPLLKRTMFQDRSKQFAKRLRWDVHVDEKGFEQDQYDELNPLYAIWQLPDGSHGGSMRFLPTSGRTMVNEHFSNLNDGRSIQDPLIWECTRFCIAPQSDRKAAASLVLAAGEILEAFGLKSFCGVFDLRMERIYRLYKIAPQIAASTGEGKNRISLGLWEMTHDAWEPALKRLGITRETSVNWFRAATMHGSSLRVPALKVFDPTV